MGTLSRRRSILIINIQDSGRKIMLNCLLMVLALTFHCKAQCSNPAVGLVGSTDHQLLYPPSYPETYPDGASCSWSILSPIDTGQIQIRVVQNDFSCCCEEDYLLIRDGASSEAKPITLLCNGITPLTITSSGPALYGEFRSDEDGRTGLGYTLQYNYFDRLYSCGFGWIKRHHYCYKLYVEQLPWQQAASQCGYDDGFLIAINNEEENTFILESFRNRISSAWMGMNSSGRWLDGSITLPDYKYKTLGDLDCLIIDLEGNGTWIASNCQSQPLGFICKKLQDGSGGRYWTDVAVDAEGAVPSNKVNIISAVIWPLASICIICICFKGRKETRLATIMLDCIHSCYCECCCGWCYECECFERLRRYVRLKIRTQQVQEPPNQSPMARSISIGSLTPSDADDEHSQAIPTAPPETPPAPREPPPAYGDRTSAPPPSYVEALDSNFDILHPNISESIPSVNPNYLTAVPSYEEALHGTFDISHTNTRHTRGLPMRFIDETIS